MGRAGRPSSSEASKLPNLRHFRVLQIFCADGLENYKKGVGMAHKMIYLGRHKI